MPSHRRITAFDVARCVAAAFAFCAIGSHPYNFYTLTRWVIFLTCLWGFWLWRNQIWPSPAPLYGSIALLFNPLLPFHFARETWQLIDLAAGICLLGTFFVRRSP